MMTGKYTGIKSISRTNPNSNIVVPLGTITQIFQWSEYI